MDDQQQWLVLVYKLPKANVRWESDRWRKLKKLGVSRFRIPLSVKNKENFQWIAADVTGIGGDASLQLTVFMSTEKEYKLNDKTLDRMAEIVNSAYTINDLMPEPEAAGFDLG